MIFSLLAASVVGTNGIPHLNGSFTVDVAGTPIIAYTYKPTNYRRDRIIMVMHGTLRNADQYRDHARKMGERFQALIVAPMFDAERFPSRRYHRGGILDEAGKATPESQWTYNFVNAIVDQVCKLEEKRIPYWIIGHSAGGQFLVRMSAFMPGKPERIIAANAGSHLFPTMDAPFGYGFGSLPPEITNVARLKAYLAAPLTFYQGTADNGPDEYFDASADAMKQGPGRLQRGRACFAAGKALAKEKGWVFGWKYVEAPGVGHDHELMFDHPRCEEAFFGSKRLEPSDY